MSSVRTPPATTVSFAGDGLASGPHHGRAGHRSSCLGADDRQLDCSGPSAGGLHHSESKAVHERSRGGLTSKIHALVDTNGLPVRLALTAGEAHDNRLADKLLSRLEPRSMLLADSSYDADCIRALAARKDAFTNIPPRCNRNDPICFSPYLYRARNLVERFFNKIKHCRRVATLAANYLAFVQLASIRLWLRVNESTS
jgi:transposase